jgi:hypothetical protein
MAPQVGHEPITLRFYKKGCQEKKFPGRAEAEKTFGIQPRSLWWLLVASCRVPGPVRNDETFTYRGHKFSQPSFPSYKEGFLQNGPEPSRARRIGAASRTLYGEDRSETIHREGKEGLRLDSISLKSNKRSGLRCGNHSSI